MIEWKTSSKLVPLPVAVRDMEHRVLGIYAGDQPELIWMLEHPHVYSGGTSSKDSHLISKLKIPVQATNRGGSYTYHGPGQRVIYVMLDLKKQGKDIRKFVWNLEQWIIDTLYGLGASGVRHQDRVGIWISGTEKNTANQHLNNDLKIASIGLRVKNWISYFGVSINVNPNLSYFDDIVPCGNVGYGVTSLEQLGFRTTLTELDIALKRSFNLYFSEA